MAKINIIEFMGFKGFDYLYTDASSMKPAFIFMDRENDIIIKVYSGQLYEFVYTNDKMVGLLVSGKYENVYDVRIFTARYNGFIGTVNKIKQAYGIGITK